MEWNRGTTPTQPTPQPAVNHTAPVANRKKKLSFLSLPTASVGLLFCITILLVALACYIAFGGNPSQKSDVDKGKLQAVFLQGGQVYFGKIKDINERFMRVSEIYYLRVNQQVQPDGTPAANNQNISLVKLGCELHGPTDSMVINQNQIIFWENLKTDGQVAKAVADYVKQNPGPQKCDAPAANNAPADTPAANTPTTPATTPPATTPARR